MVVLVCVLKAFHVYFSLWLVVTVLLLPLKLLLVHFFIHIGLSVKLRHAILGVLQYYIGNVSNLSLFFLGACIFFFSFGFKQLNTRYVPLVNY